MKFRRDALRSGMWVHVRSNWWLGRLIRYGLDKWEARTCKRLGVPPVPVWGNHDGIIILEDVGGSGVGIGEALENGSVVTPFEEYEREMMTGRIQVRVFIPICDAPLPTMRQAAMNWIIDVKTEPYDYWAWAGMIWKCLWDVEVPTEQRMSYYCTEGIEAAYDMRPPGLDICQDDMPTPMAVEQAAGLIPRPAGRAIRLREVTDSVLA